MQNELSFTDVIGKFFASTLTGCPLNRSEEL